MRVELVYSPMRGSVRRYEIALAASATVAQAIEATGVLREFPEIDLSGGFGLAVFGKRATPETALEEGDRVEILRPLTVDPKEARRGRARRGREAQQR